MSAPRPAGDHPDDLPPVEPLRELARPVAAPDLTGAVMSRLGLRPVSPRVARRRRFGRGVARLALVAVAVGASALCVQWHEMSVGAQRPAGPTIPSAIEHDLEHHGQTIDRAIRSIRGLAPWRPEGGPGSVPTVPDHDETTEDPPEPQAPVAPPWV